MLYIMFTDLKLEYSRTIKNSYQIIIHFSSTQILENKKLDVLIILIINVVN